MANVKQAQPIAFADRPVAVEPGSASDIALITLLVAKLAVQEPLRATQTSLSS